MLDLGFSVARYLPEPLLQLGPRGLNWWQWIGLPIALLLALAGGKALSRLCQYGLRKLASRTRSDLDDRLTSRLGGPLTLASTVLVLYLLMSLLELPASAEAFANKLFKSALFVDFFWVLFRLLDVGAHILSLSPWARGHAASRSLLPLGVRIGKVALFGLAIVAMLAEFGYNVSSLIAGLGIGGLALALAAQKTVENLFGAFSIGLDQPFREGDFIKAEGAMGTVEAVGLRSTRIRTVDRTLLSIPNGKLADMRLESVAARDRIRLGLTLPLVYSTSAAAVRKVIADVEALILASAKVASDSVVVKLREFGECALLIEVAAIYNTADFGEFMVMRQELLLAIMEAVEAAGSAVAMPTRTLHLVTPISFGDGLHSKTGGATMPPAHEQPQEYDKERPAGQRAGDPEAHS